MAIAMFGCKGKSMGGGEVYFRTINSQLKRWLHENMDPTYNPCIWRTRDKPTGFAAHFANKGCYIIGKGPSLDNLWVGNFPQTDWPIIAVNEAIHEVENLNLPNPQYGIVQDAWISQKCIPKRAKLLVPPKLINKLKHVENKYIIPSSIKSTRALTAALAVSFARYFGCNQLDMLCFDACVDGTLGYATCIPYAPSRDGKPDRFLDHRRQYAHFVRDIKCRWLLPKHETPLVVGYYTPEYVNFIKEMVASVSYPVYTKEYPSTGNWAKNTYIKPKFLLHCLDKFPDQKLFVYLDADAVLMQPFKHEFPATISAVASKTDGVSSNTIAFRPEARSVFERWATIALRYPRGDQAGLFNALACDFEYLPKGYVHIFDQPEEEEVFVVANQASRKMRRRICPASVQLLESSCDSKVNTQTKRTTPEAKPSAVSLSRVSTSGSVNTEGVGIGQILQRMKSDVAGATRSGT